MDLAGKWQIAFMSEADDNGFFWNSADALRAKAIEEQDKDTLMLLDALYVFEQGGKVIIAMKLPEAASPEEIAQAVEAGAIKLYGDDRFFTAERAWKLENGVPMYDTGVKGEVLVEEVGSWVEIEAVGDCIELPFMRLRRAE